jgi:hypothetical protein
VSVRLTGALVAALALLAALPAVAAAELSPGAQRVYDDYRSDAAIRPCDHSVKLYRRTLREVTPDIEEETPAFRPAVEAALREREKGAGNCAAPGDEAEGQDETGGAAPVAPPAQPPSAKPAPAPAKPPAAAPAQPQPSTGQPAPAVTPTATVAPPPVTSSAPAPAADPVLVDRPHEGTPVGLLIALGLLALALLAVLLALAARRFGWGEERLAGTRHAWGEAAYRAGGTWGDFVDWVRLR